MGVGGARWRKLSTVIYARNGASRLEALAPRALPTMAELTGEAAAVPAAVPAVLETATETTPAPPARRCSGLPHGVKAVKKSGKYQGQVYDSLDAKKQRGVGTFATAELAAAAVERAEGQLKEGVSPWAAPTRVNQYKRGEAPKPVAKKRVPPVVVNEPPSFSAKLPKLNEIKDDGMRTFFESRSGEEI